jgi:cardiolipin synthase
VIVPPVAPEPDPALLTLRPNGSIDERSRLDDVTSATATGSDRGDLPDGEVDSIWTWPNLFTLLRLLCLPIFLWLLFVVESRQAAGWMLGALGATDWVDGYLARRLGQTSEFGKKFDPTVDRVLFVVAVIAIMIDGSMPLWFGIAVLVREVAVGVSVAVATLFFGMERFDVTWLGKLATFLLMFAVPGFLMAESTVPGAEYFAIATWILGIPGLVLSYYTGIQYIPKIRAGIAAGRSRDR